MGGGIGRRADVPVARTTGECGSGLLGTFKDVCGGLVNGGGVRAERIVPFSGMNAPGGEAFLHDFSPEREKELKRNIICHSGGQVCSSGLRQFKKG